MFSRSIAYYFELSTNFKITSISIFEILSNDNKTSVIANNIQNTVMKPKLNL